MRTQTNCSLLVKMKHSENHKSTSRRAFLRELLSPLLAGASVGAITGIFGSSLALKLESILEQIELENLHLYRQIIYELNVEDLLQHSENLLSSKRSTNLKLNKLNIVSQRLTDFEKSENNSHAIKYQIRRIKDFLQNYSSN